MNEIGIKHDFGKLRWDLVDWNTMEDVAAVLTSALKKYEANNWQHVEHGKQRYFAATMRHLIAWEQGILLDEETGLPHLTHAICNLMFLNWFDNNGN